jgi:aspartokinase
MRIKIKSDGLASGTLICNENNNPIVRVQKVEIYGDINSPFLTGTITVNKPIIDIFFDGELYNERSTQASEVFNEFKQLYTNEELSPTFQEAFKVIYNKLHSIVFKD